MINCVRGHFLTAIELTIDRMALK